MSTWVQLKDGVAFASVESPNLVGNSILLDEGTLFDDIKAMKYENDSWSFAPLIHFVTSIKDGLVTGINSTVFSSDAIGIVCQPEVGIGWTYDGANFTAPVEEPIV